MIKILQRQQGSATIETALTFPVIMLMTMFIIQFGTLIYARQCAEEAARYGVRMGVVNVGNPVGGAVAAASQYAASALPWGHQVEVEAPGGIVGTTMRLRVNTTPPNILGPILNYFGGRSGGGYQISAIAEGRMEGWQP